MYCAANSDRLVTKSEIAERCNISENHLAQVINQLAQLGYLRTQRGRNGGRVWADLLARSGLAMCFATSRARFRWWSVLPMPTTPAR